MRPSPRSLGCALALSLAAAPASAGEAPRTSSLGWVRLPGADACIGTRDLSQAVEHRLGRLVFVSPTQAEVLVEGRIEPAPAGPGFHAHLALTDARGLVLGTRDLDAADGGCRALDEQLALVIALLIDPDAALAPHPPAAPQIVVERVFVPVPAPSPPPAPERWRESLTAGAVVAAGLLPRAGVGLALRGEIVPPGFFPIELGGTVWLDAQAAVSGAPSKGSSVSLSYATLGLCPLAWGPDATRVRGCAGVSFGAVRAVGHGFTTSEGAGQETPVGQATVEGRVTRRLVGPLELGVGLGLAVPFNRARFFYVDAAKNEQELFRMAAVAGLVDLGLGLSFP